MYRQRCVIAGYMKLLLTILKFSQYHIQTVCKDKHTQISGTGEAMTSTPEDENRALSPGRLLYDRILGDIPLRLIYAVTELNIADDVERRQFRKRIEERGFWLRDNQHVTLVDLLPSANA